MNRRLPAKFVLVAAAIATAGNPGPVSAQWAVFDAGNFAQTLATAAATAEHVRQMVQQLSNMEQQLRNQAQSLKSLDATSFHGLMDSIRTVTMAKSTILGQVDAISFSTQQVDADFRRLFPNGPAEWRTLSSRDLDSRVSAWNSELASSSLIAMRTQTHLSNVEEASLSAQRILEGSGVAAGEVRQLQGITQMLGVIQNQMGSLIQILSTGGRVTSDLAASTASKEMMLQEGKRRRLEGYANPGPPARKLSRLPQPGR